jgi:hypothetical protein
MLANSNIKKGRIMPIYDDKYMEYNDLRSEVDIQRAKGNIELSEHLRIIADELRDDILSDYDAVTDN